MLVLPVYFLQKLEAQLDTQPRNPIPVGSQEKYLKMASVVAKEPWGLVRAAKYIEGWIANARTKAAHVPPEIIQFDEWEKIKDQQQFVEHAPRTDTVFNHDVREIVVGKAPPTPKQKDSKAAPDAPPPPKNEAPKAASKAPPPPHPKHEAPKAALKAPPPPHPKNEAPKAAAPKAPPPPPKNAAPKADPMAPPPPKKAGPPAPKVGGPLMKAAGMASFFDFVSLRWYSLPRQSSSV